MKKINQLLFVILLFSTISANAQNFSIFEKENNYFFENSSEMFAVKADSSVVLSSGDTSYYFLNMYWDPIYNPINCADLFAGSLFGRKATNRADTVFVMYNYLLDSLVFKTHYPRGESWIVYRWPTQDLILKASITDQSTQNVMGVLDEVKTITFSVQNSFNQSVTTNPFHDKFLLLSENFGLLNAFNFYKFPNDTLLYDLVDITPTSEYRMKTIKKIYDFNIGDEFHTFFTDVRYGMNNTVYDGTIQRVIQKVVSKTTYNPDTAITYQFERCQMIFNYLNYIVDTTYTYDTVTTVYSYCNFSDSSLFQMPRETFYRPIGIYENNFLTLKDYNNRLEYKYIDRLDYYFNNNCWDFTYIDPGPNVTQYYEGLGGPFYNYYIWSSYLCLKRINLVYYKKGETTWGSPIAPNCLSLINDVQELKPSASEVNIYPNPARNKVFVDLKNVDSKSVTIEIFSLEGKMLQQQTIATNSISEIDIQSLPSGMFVLKIRDKNQIIVKLLNKMR